jgi:hypothetical protein
MINNSKKMEKVSLYATSALVMLWTRPDCYPSFEAQRYMMRLETDQGLKLYEQCQRICPFYTEVIANRKFGVWSLVKDSVHNDFKQIVILGAGLAPLSIQICENYRDIQVFDVDIESMNEKHLMIRSLQNQALDNVHCVSVDMTKTDLLCRELQAHGWNPFSPTAVVLEGISYYLTPGNLRGLVDLFSSKQKGSRLIFEYLLPDECIAIANRDIPRQVFGIIETACAIPAITKLTSSQISEQYGCSLLQRYSIHELERKRTGSNVHFPREDDGWIEVAYFSI